MLHKDKSIIAPETFKLTQELQALPELKNFYLVGGTALALQLGHRTSVDIDLFIEQSYDAESLMDLIKSKYVFTLVYSNKQTIIGIINGIKVDFISHKYKIIRAIIKEENISMLSLEDICAMKLHAITNSGQRLKDFIDIYFLLEHFSISQMLDFYHEKYPMMNKVIPLRAITFFDDIDPKLDPPKLLKPLPIEKIKKRIDDGVIHPYKVFNV
jgi:predicted nucleotidyltransferase component of viral defense system